MITKYVIGQKIVRVVQSRIKTNAGLMTSVSYIELENGVRLIPFAMETESDPIGDITVNSVKRKASRPEAADSVPGGNEKQPVDQVSPNPASSSLGAINNE